MRTVLVLKVKSTRTYPGLHRPRWRRWTSPTTASAGRARSRPARPGRRSRSRPRSDSCSRVGRQNPHRALGAPRHRDRAGRSASPPRATCPPTGPSRSSAARSRAPRPGSSASATTSAPSRSSRSSSPRRGRRGRASASRARRRHPLRNRRHAGVVGASLLASHVRKRACSLVVVVVDRRRRDRHRRVRPVPDPPRIDDGVRSRSERSSSRPRWCSPATSARRHRTRHGSAAARCTARRTATRSRSRSTTGPNIGATEKVMAILDAHGIKGTFFEVGKAIDKEPQITRALYADGQLLGNHSYHHDQWRWLDPRYPELQRTQDAFERAIGTCPVLYRPPHGDRTPFLAQVVRDHHMHMVLWSASAGDWATNDAQLVARRILAGARPARSCCCTTASTATRPPNRRCSCGRCRSSSTGSARRASCRCASIGCSAPPRTSPAERSTDASGRERAAGIAPTAPAK